MLDTIWFYFVIFCFYLVFCTISEALWLPLVADPEMDLKVYNIQIYSVKKNSNKDWKYKCLGAVM